MTQLSFTICLLNSFTAQNSGTGNNLFWTTTSEINSDYFNVEQRINGVNFNELGKVKVAVNSVVNNNYEFTDSHNHSGINYYRLKMVDKDGQFAYSKIVAVNNKSGAMIRLFPNPAKEILEVRISSYNKAKEIMVQIRDLQGRLMQSHKMNLINGVSDFKLDISSLASGAYILEMNGENARQIFLKE